jgi:hypothetical protein
MVKHFAKVLDERVIQVVVSDPEFLEDLSNQENAKWVETCYNTRLGIYYDPETRKPASDQSKALRKNYAGIGHVYDSALDAFILPKPYGSWIFDEFSGDWNSPVPFPTDGKFYKWNEDVQNWEETTEI